MKTMELEPNWQSFFELAQQIAKEEIPENKQAVVLEMLKYGQRLDRERNLPHFLRHD